MEKALSTAEIRELNRQYQERVNQYSKGRAYVSRAEKLRFDGNDNLTSRYRINPDGTISRG